VGFINANAYNGGDAIGASHNGHVQFSDGLAGPQLAITIKRNTVTPGYAVGSETSAVRPGSHHTESEPPFALCVTVSCVT